MMYFKLKTTIDNFCDKISRGKLAQISDDFMIIARIESLILEVGYGRCASLEQRLILRQVQMAL